MSWIGDMFNDIGRALNTVTPNEVKPIVKAIAAPVAIAVTGVVSIPAILTVTALANIATGQNPTDAIKNAAISTVTSSVGSSLVGSAASDVTNAVLNDTAKNVIVSGATVGNVVSGAITKAATGAATAALTGGDVVKGAEAGAVGGALTPVISNVINSSLGATPSTGGYSGIPETPAKLPSIGGSTAAGEIFSNILTPTITGTVAGIATGKTPEAAFKSSIPSAISGGLSAGAQYGLGLDPSLSGLIGETGSTAYKYATTPSPSTPSYTTPVQPSLNLQGPQSATVAGPSATLGQSLSIAPTLGYTPTGSVFGSSDADGQKSNVWNVGSLRNVGAAEA